MQPLSNFHTRGFCNRCHLLQSLAEMKLGRTMLLAPAQCRCLLAWAWSCRGRKLQPTHGSQHLALPLWGGAVGRQDV